MTSQVDVANDALTLLGGDRITALDQDTTGAKIMTQFMDRSIEAVLRSHPWHCAKEQKELAQLATGPVFDWDYRYQLPTNPKCLRVLKVYEAEDNKWAKKGTALYCNLSTCKIEYIQVIGVHVMDPLLVDALAAFLAYKAAVPLTESTSKRDQMLQLYRELRFEAMDADLHEQGKIRTATSRLQSVR